MDYLEYKLDKKLSFISGKLISAFAPWLIKAVEIGGCLLSLYFFKRMHLYDARYISEFQKLRVNDII